MHTLFMQGKNKVLVRYLQGPLSRLIRAKYSALILGPRQTGKTTLVNACLKGRAHVMEYPLQNPSVRNELERNPGRIIDQVRAQSERPTVFIDEAQKIPALFDALQVILDAGEASCILTGSSARKLRRSGVNLLPGRVKRYHLDPLMWGELGWLREGILKNLRMKNINRSAHYSLEDSMIYGTLPGMVHLPNKDRPDFLKAYAEIYLEEEIRAEAILRKIGAFSRFLELSAAESGTNPNLTKLSNESGVSLPAIRSFYEILEDTMVIERVDPFLRNARKRILSSSRYYFFDPGVRNVLARFPLESRMLNVQKGILFEHAVILEIRRRIRALNRNYKTLYWRTSGGAEVDCVVDMGNKVIPIEIKSSARVEKSDIKGLRNFLDDYPGLAKHGYVVFMGSRKEQMSSNITAIPWQEL